MYALSSISTAEFYMALGIALLIEALPYIFVAGIFAFVIYKKRYEAAAVAKDFDKAAEEAYNRYLKARILKAIAEGSKEQRQEAMKLLEVYDLKYHSPKSGALSCKMEDGTEVDFVTFTNSVLKRIGY